MVVWGEFGVWLCGESLGSGSVGRVWGVVVWGEFGVW